MEGNGLDCWVGCNNLPTVEEVLLWQPSSCQKRERILLLSDIHANWHALVSVLRHAQQQGYDTTWFLGDIVGYGPRPVECVRWLREQVGRQGDWVVGNHDLGVLGLMTEELGGRTFPEAIATWKIHRQLLEESPQLLEWFRGAVEARYEQLGPVQNCHGVLRQQFVHSYPRDPVGNNLYPYETFNIVVLLRALAGELGQCSAGWLLVGHTHMAYLASLWPGYDRVELMPITYGEPIPLTKGCHLINPGSVGQPRDGDPRPAYAILDVAQGTVTYYRVGVDYGYKPLDVELELLKNACYPEVLVEWLGTGCTPATRHFKRVYRRHDDGSGITPLRRAGFSHVS